MPRLALVLAIASVLCSLSIAAFFIGVSLGLLAVIMGLTAAIGRPKGSVGERTAQRAFVIGGLGLLMGVVVWVVHVRAIQTAYQVPNRDQLHADFQQQVAHATAPLPTAPPRASAKDTR
jgi:hypothetical protein